MSILDKVKSMMPGSGSQSESGKHKRQGKTSEKVDRAAERMDDATKGRFSDQIESGRDKIQERLDDR